MKITIKGKKTFITDVYELKSAWWAHKMPLDV